MEDDAIHLFCLRLSRKLASVIEPGMKPDSRLDLWRTLYDCIRADLERYEKERAA